MEFDFDFVRRKAEEYFTQYNMNLQEIKEILINYDIYPFQTKYNEELHTIYSTDGSFINYWKSPLSNLYIGGVRIGFVKQKYTIQPKQTYIEECGASNEFVCMDLRETNIVAKDILGYVMELRERQHLYDFASQSENEMIMVDGSLIEPYHMNRKENILTQYKAIIGEEIYNEINHHSSMADLIEICNEKNHILVGVVKDSKRIMVKNMRYEVALEKAIEVKGMRKDGTYYFETPRESIHALQHETETPFGSVFAKLHAKAIKWHRIDYLKNDRDLETDILPTLANASLYNRYFGSPRAPQVCDSIAVEIRQRKEKTLQKIYAILKEIGFSKGDIMFGTTDVNGEKSIQSRSAHDLFDTNRRASRDRTQI